MQTVVSPNWICLWILFAWVVPCCPVQHVAGQMSEAKTVKGAMAILRTGLQTATDYTGPQSFPFGWLKDDRIHWKQLTRCAEAIWDFAGRAVIGKRLWSKLDNLLSLHVRSLQFSRGTGNKEEMYVHATPSHKVSYSVPLRLQPPTHGSLESCQFPHGAWPQGGYEETSRGQCGVEVTSKSDTGALKLYILLWYFCA